MPVLLTDGYAAPMSKYRLALIGCGKLSSIVANACERGLLPEYELTAVLGRDLEKTKKFAARYGCTTCGSIDELLAREPDFTAGGSSVQGVRDYAEALLSGGSNIVILSVGAFADQEFYEAVQQTAREANRRVYIASGAVGGFDVLRTAALMGPLNASFASKKSPDAVLNTGLASPDLAALTESRTLFTGTATQAIAVLPTHVNVAVAAALASVGTDQTQVTITAVPGFEGDEHTIEAHGDEVRVELKVYSRTSAIAGWSVVATLQNAVSPIVF